MHLKTNFLFDCVMNSGTENNEPRYAHSSYERSECCNDVILPRSKAILEHAHSATFKLPDVKAPTVTQHKGTARYIRPQKLLVSSSLDASPTNSESADTTDKGDHINSKQKLKPQRRSWNSNDALSDILHKQRQETIRPSDLKILQQDPSSFEFNEKFHSLSCDDSKYNTKDCNFTSSCQNSRMKSRLESLKLEKLSFPFPPSSPSSPVALSPLSASRKQVVAGDNLLVAEKSGILSDVNVSAEENSYTRSVTLSESRTQTLAFSSYSVEVCHNNLDWGMLSPEPPMIIDSNPPGNLHQNMTPKSKSEPCHGSLHFISTADTLVNSRNHSSIQTSDSTNDESRCIEKTSSKEESRNALPTAGATSKNNDTMKSAMQELVSFFFPNSSSNGEGRTRSTKSDRKSSSIESASKVSESDGNACNSITDGVNKMANMFLSLRNGRLRLHSTSNQQSLNSYNSVVEETNANDDFDSCADNVRQNPLITTSPNTMESSKDEFEPARVSSISTALYATEDYNAVDSNRCVASDIHVEDEIYSLTELMHLIEASASNEREAADDTQPVDYEDTAVAPGSELRKDLSCVDITNGLLCTKVLFSSNDEQDDATRWAAAMQGDHSSTLAPVIDQTVASVSEECKIAFSKEEEEKATVVSLPIPRERALTRKHVPKHHILIDDARMHAQASYLKRWSEREEIRSMACAPLSFFGPGHVGYGFVSSMIIHSKILKLTVSFHGTQSFQDVLTDLQFRPGSLRKLKLNGQMHIGIRDRYLHIRNELYNIVQKHALEGGMQFATDVLLVFTGHSLGAGLAHLAALDYKVNFGFKNVFCVSFSCPQVFDAEACAQYNREMLARSYRLVIDGDIIPAFVTVIYHHVERLIKYKPKRVFQKINPFAVHNLTNYRRTQMLRFRTGFKISSVLRANKPINAIEGKKLSKPNNGHSNA